jgi:hypothetical protein
MFCDCTSHPFFFLSLSHQSPGSCPPLCHVLPCLPAPAMSPTRHIIQMASMACTYAVAGSMVLQTQSGGGNMLVGDLHRYIVGLCDLPTIYLLHEGRVGRSRRTAPYLPIANVPALVLSFSSEGPSTSLRFLFLLVVSRRPFLLRVDVHGHTHTHQSPDSLMFLHHLNYFSYKCNLYEDHPTIYHSFIHSHRSRLGPPQRRSAAPVLINSHCCAHPARYCAESSEAIYHLCGS